MSQHINDTFLLELYKASLTSKSFLDIVSKHLAYHYIPQQEYKALFEKIVQQYELNREVPTIGSLSQQFNANEEVLKLLHKMTSINVADKKDTLLATFEKFLIERKFVDLYSKLGPLYNDGKQEQAIKLLQKESEVLSNFSIKDAYYTRVFGDYTQRLEERQLKSRTQEAIKVPFSIHALDYITKGGISLGTSALFLAMSGKGKSTLMRWIGMSAARLGFRVVHFQQEGTEQECLDAYDAAWTSINLDDIEFGIVPKELESKIEKANKDIIAGRGEVFVKAASGFDELTINDCAEFVEDIERIHGKVHLVIFDYLELFSVKGQYHNTEAGERKRREDVANKMTGVAVTYNCAVITATQANDIKPERWNNPDNVLTRSDISEFKGALKPFSYFITLNQTQDEYNSEIVRLYVDKLRKYRLPYKPYKIAQSLNNSRFYNAKRSLDLFWDDRLKKEK